MYFQSLAVAVPLLSLVAAAPFEEAKLEARQSCTFAQKVAGIQHEIDTITSHSFTDANQIPLAPLATRTFLVTPAELGGKVTLPPINVGVTAETVRAELVGLATVLFASVPGPNHATYINNANGSVTADFIQNDNIVLPSEHVREIHYFNSDCQITEILGYVNGPLICPDGASPVSNAVVEQLCAELEAATSSS
ncbi:hypothetical protein BDY17DRAFT_309974 [Neohortaea acidophila]|uniref:Uncharacterized protein n=1 Tax=Neohortaea acidophila TaxID=245834 RepID=A0A6A6PRW0_9PEZI|nr:uncharacterized protein BDY17DRAFT_309974 [Neohortaea acidophila]KAF2482868.1 hypothetical protein BDY17DRAFT_309974 [Neohortaea acidophila]